MTESELLLLQFFAASILASVLLLLLARRGRNLRRFTDRQHFHLDLYRFIVTIVTALAIYLIGRDIDILRRLNLPDALLLFGTTALPTMLICSLSGRWYLGYGTTLLVQGMILYTLSVEHPGFLTSPLAALLWQHAVCDLIGLTLYGWLSRMTRTAERKMKETQSLLRYLALQRKNSSAS
jgi:hypothetical protein